MLDCTKILGLIAVSDDPDKLRTWIENARKRQQKEIEDAAFRRLIAILPKETPGTVEYDLWQTIYAFELVLSVERGKTTRLSRTRQKVARVGEVETLKDWAVSTKSTDGFKMLIERKMPELTGEAIVLRHAGKFESDVVVAARKRLVEAGIDIDALLAKANGPEDDFDDVEDNGREGDEMFSVVDGKKVDAHLHEEMLNGADPVAVDQFARENARNIGFAEEQILSLFGPPVRVRGPEFLPGIPASHVLGRLAKAGGREIKSGRLSSPESSAALAVNCFGWFIEQPEQLPPLRGLETAGVPELVDVEFCARFPWSGGRHPWLDAVVQTPTTLIGIESKRFEPFRDVKSVCLSDAFDRPVWGGNMKGYERMRDRLRSGEERFVHLDAAQLVKHAFGLVTEGARRHRTPVLFYLFAEPAARNGRAIALDALARHRDEISRFAKEVAGDEVTFHFASYREWLGTWHGRDSNISAHGQAIMESFEP